jgi:hypothetical protein
VTAELNLLWPAVVAVAEALLANQRLSGNEVVATIKLALTPSEWDRD